MPLICLLLSISEDLDALPAETLHESPPRSPLNQSCPRSWTFDQTYPNICYYYDHRGPYIYKVDWYKAANYCYELNPQATLPIFHDLSEYISYSKYIFDFTSSGYCNIISLLGISYNATTKNYSWIDGSNVTFNFYEHDMVLKENYSFYHSLFGSNKWEQKAKTYSSPNGFFTVCQLRINKNSLLKTTTNVSLDYPKSRKCPQKENWFYDDYSDICYYYDRLAIPRNWTSAFAHCKSEVGGSLPYFMTEKEFDSFVNLTRMLLVHCWNDVWLGYHGKYKYFVTVNGSANSFITWYFGYPKIYSNISYVSFNWYMSAFKNEDNKTMTKNVFCQCQSGNCKTEKIETLRESPPRSPLNQSCPLSWTFDPSYPNICYYNDQFDMNSVDWYKAVNYCYELNPQATLPIFHDLSEYISYCKWVYERLPLYSCSYWNWLGISYNTTTKNYSWIDGSNVSFNFYDHDMVLKENYSFSHSLFGSNKWKQIAKTDIYASAFHVCQLRINKNSLLKTTTNMSLNYPKSRKCPQKDNWFYDDYSDICYYYNEHDSHDWTSAFAHCKAKVGGSLPYFLTEKEFNSFVKLINKLHVPCDTRIWLGYLGTNNSFVNVNGSANSFLKWISYFPRIHSQNYVYFYWKDNAFYRNDLKTTTKNVFCQCRSGNCKTE